MSKRAISRAALFAGTLSLALSPLLASTTQAQDRGGYPGPDGPPPSQGYPQQQGYPARGYQPQPYAGDNGGQYRDEYAQSQGEMPPPPGYDGTRMPPPPPGYDPGADYAAQQQADQRYAYEASQWARQYCVKAHGNAGTGALIGGLFGAILGNGLAGRGDRGVGTFAGAAVGAAGGAVIAGSSNSNSTSPGCPPGHVVRRGAPHYAYGATGYYYAAPGWYRPWVFVDGDWAYRPYPYHNWYYRRYHDGWSDRDGGREHGNWRSDQGDHGDRSDRNRRGH